MSSRYNEKIPKMPKIDFHIVEPQITSHTLTQETSRALTDDDRIKNISAKNSKPDQLFQY